MAPALSGVMVTLKSHDAEGRMIYVARAVDHRPAEATQRVGRELSAMLTAAGFRPIDPVQTPFPGFAGRNILSEFDRVHSDLAWLRRSDALVADLSIPDWPYVGCICELVYARLYEVPAVVITGDNVIGERVWLQFHADAVVRTGEEAVSFLERLPHGARAKRVA